MARSKKGGGTSAAAAPVRDARGLAAGELVAGRYEVLGPIGEGGMGAVYRVRDRLASGAARDDLALKTIRAPEPALLAALRSEFATLAGLRHGHLARVHDYGHDPERAMAYFTSELVPGGVHLLKWAAQAGAAAFAEAIGQLCEALDYIHRQGLVHRDVKPQNVLVEALEGGGFRAVLVDFGLAALGAHGAAAPGSRGTGRAAGAAGAAAKGARAGLAPAGTLPYLAPELLRGAPASAASDLYALGVLVAQHFVGERIVRRGAGRDLRGEAGQAAVPAAWRPALARLLSPDPVERIADARDLRAALEEAGLLAPPRHGAGAEGVESAAAPLVGRGPVMERLAALERALTAQFEAAVKSTAAAASTAPPPAVLVLRGPPGAGRTRILAELRRRTQPALAGSGAFALGQCAAAPRPLADVAALARAVVAALGPEHAATRQHAAALGRLLVGEEVGSGASADVAAALLPPTATTASDEAALLGDALASFVAAAGEVVPIWLALDDVEAAESDSGLLVAYLVRRLAVAHARGARRPIVMLAMADGGAPAPALAAALEDAEHAGALETLRLEPLARDAVEEMARSLLGTERMPAAFVAELHEASGGVPSMVASICATLLESLGRDVARGARAGVPLEGVELRKLDLPRGLEESLAQRIGGLGRAEGKLLRLLAAAERPLPAAVLAAAAETPLASTEQALTELSSRGFARAEGPDGGEGPGAGSGGGAAAAAAAAPPPSWRIAGHALARATLRRAGKAAAERAHADLARAWSESAPAPLPEREQELVAIHLCKAADARGAPLALEVGRGRDAAGRTREALRLYALGAPLATGETRRALLQGACDLHARTGAYDQAIAAAQGLLDLPVLPARADDEQDAAAAAAATLAAVESAAAVRLRLGELYVLAGRHEEALGLLEAALRSARGKTAGLAHALAARALVLRGEHAAALARAEEALRLLAMADAVPSVPSEIAQVHATVGLARYYGGAYEEGIESLRQALALYRQDGGSPREEAFVLNCLGLCYHRKGAYDRALEYYARSAAAARAMGDRARAGRAAANQGVVAQLAGDYAAARAAYDESLDAARVVGDRVGVRRALVKLANLYAGLGALGRARKLTDEYRQAAEREGDRSDAAFARLILGGIALKAEERAPARALLEQALAEFRALDAPSEEAEAQLDLARLHLEVRDWPAAEAALVAARALVEGHGLKALAPRATVLAAEIALARGDAPGALVAALEEAAAAAAGLAPPLRWRMHAVYARALGAAGRHDEARPQALAAKEILAAMAARIPEDLRADFAADRERREVIATLDLLAAAPAAVLAGGGASTGATAATAARSHPSRAPARAALGTFAPADLEELLKINKRLTSETDLDKLLAVIMDTAIDLCGAERGFVLLVGEDIDDIRVAVARDMERESLEEGARGAISMSLAREVIATGDPVVTVDAMDDSRFRGMMSIVDLRLRSVMCAPLVHRGKPLGAIYVDNRYRREAFGEEHLRLLEAFADQAAIALANARHLAALARQREEIERSRNEIAELNRKLEAQLADRTRALDRTKADLLRARRELSQKYEYSNIVGQGVAMRRVLAVLDRVTDSDLPVVIRGESGTGKELVARAIHFNGPRAEGPFLALNCAALAENLLESELFGHMRGAFTGADRDRKGLFEAANTGTLFLDEVGDMPPAMQVKLLRALQEGEVTRVGGRAPIKVDVRITAASNKDLDELKAKGLFREDLYYRLNVVRIDLPALRERRDDLPDLVAHFMERFRAQNGDRGPRAIAPEALALLASYAWPGNVRELEAAIGGACLFCTGDVLTVADLSIKPELLRRGAADGTVASMAGRPLDEIERILILATLERTGGNKLETAKLLGIDRKTLYNKLRRYQQEGLLPPGLVP
ncbi:MAG TPA: sigma 54-interacting transcriptional regulator [Myxococcota bacterium]|jgi:transcriptional regulator with GAF, ATPase, and Fis domain|nr:sigma 54-interacting transcriptional regulator [Myxococcota bacterium]